MQRRFKEPENESGQMAEIYRLDPITTTRLGQSEKSPKEIIFKYAPHENFDFKEPKNPNKISYASLDDNLELRYILIISRPEALVEGTKISDYYGKSSLVFVVTSLTQETNHRVFDDLQQRTGIELITPTHSPYFSDIILSNLKDFCLFSTQLLRDKNRREEGNKE